MTSDWDDLIDLDDDMNLECIFCMTIQSLVPLPNQYHYTCTYILHQLCNATTSSSCQFEMNYVENRWNVAFSDECMHVFSYNMQECKSGDDRDQTIFTGS